MILSRLPSSSAVTRLPAASSAFQLSVLMPSLNQVAFIERAVRSVLTQGGVELELLVVDGGSIDGTQALLARLGDEFAPNLRWISEPDRGPANALNKALAMAHGQVIGWLNADDAYMPGAAQRALAYLTAHPHHVMVYGHGEHIDAQDQPLGHYPSRPPAAGLPGFADGCFICQPTVFMRQSVLQSAGGFDESQRTAFDMELWMKLFAAYPGCIGWLDALQARSRLHAATITSTQRSRVMRESMQLLAKHLGHAPLHWVRSHVDEVLAEHAAAPSGDDARAQLNQLAAEVSPLLSPADRLALRQWWTSDMRLRLLQPHLGLPVGHDGWLPASALMRVREGAGTRVVMVGRHVSSLPGPLEVRIGDRDGHRITHIVRQPGQFRLEVPLTGACGPDGWHVTFEMAPVFTPSEHLAGSTDHRRLGCVVDQLQVLA